MKLLFRLCSHLFIAVYGRFPVLGELRSSVAVVQRNGEYLLQWRSDGLGWAFPGGTSRWREPVEATLRREFREETGMEIVSCQFLFAYSDRNYIPHRVSIFTAEATGEPRPSWEGEIYWKRLDPVPQPFFTPLLPVLAHLQAQSSSQ